MSRRRRTGNWLEGREPPEGERLVALVGVDVRAALPQLAPDLDFTFSQEVHIAVVTA